MIILAFVAVLMAQSPTPQTQPAGSPALTANADADMAQLEALNREWLEAYQNHDGAALDRVLADDFQAVYPGNRLSSKADLIAGAVRPGRIIEQLSWKDLRILTFGDTAVVTATVTMSGTANGSAFTATNAYADIYARREGRWRAISAHVVRVGE